MIKLLFKGKVHIKSHMGLGINQDKDVYVIASNPEEAAKSISKHFSDSTLKSVEHVQGEVVI